MLRTISVVLLAACVSLSAGQAPLECFEDLGLISSLTQVQEKDRMDINVMMVPAFLGFLSEYVQVSNNPSEYNLPGQEKARVIWACSYFSRVKDALASYESQISGSYPELSEAVLYAMKQLTPGEITVSATAPDYWHGIALDLEQRLADITERMEQTVQGATPENKVALTRGGILEFIGNILAAASATGENDSEWYWLTQSANINTEFACNLTFLFLICKFPEGLAPGSEISPRLSELTEKGSKILWEGMDYFETGDDYELLTEMAIEFSRDYGIELLSNLSGSCNP